MNTNNTRTACSCATNNDGTVTAILCPAHASTDPCRTVASITGRRRRGSISRGCCSKCGWTEQAREVSK